MLSNEELNEFSAVDAGGPIFSSHDVGGPGDVEFTQAVFATDDVLAIPVPSYLCRFIVNWRGSSSEGEFSRQVRDGFKERLKSESVLVIISVGSDFSGHFIRGHGADDQDRYLRETFAHYRKKLKPRHSEHSEGK